MYRSYRLVQLKFYNPAATLEFSRLASKGKSEITGLSDPRSEEK